MIAYDVLVKSLVDEAIKLGPEESPTGLIAAINADSDPIRAIYDHDKSLILQEAFSKQFGLLVGLAAGGRPPVVADITRWAALVRWVMRELRDWRSDADPKRYRLSTLLFTAACCDLGNHLWGALPDRIGNNSDLLEVLERYIATAKSGFTSRGMQLEPIWEKEVLERFRQADASGNWEAIGEMWHYIRDAIEPNIFFTQVTRCLHRYDPDRITRALANLKQILLPIQVLRALPVDGNLAIGCASRNPYVEMACALETFAHWRKNHRPNVSEQQMLTCLLSKVAIDQPRWLQWMKIFNRYPVRYPAIQISLGEALAAMPVSAVEAYVDTIELTVSPDGGREMVAECLRAFRAIASADRARLVWKRAYELWSGWQFGIDEVEKHLFRISFSELDYPVVGYVVDCMTDDERSAIQTELLKKISTLTGLWHASMVDCSTAWHRLLSQYQPYGHGQSVKQTRGDWLQTGHEIWPFDPQKEPYTMLMFRGS